MTDQEYDESFTSDVSSDKDNQQAKKFWLNCQFHDQQHEQVKKPDEIENEIEDPSFDVDEEVYNRIQGSIFGMAVGDALGAHVEFRPRQYLVDKPVEDLGEGGTWGLQKGQFTDDTSMALCLANSLIYCEGFNAYDQLVRYNWWHKHGYMSSTGTCFDIGSATKQALNEFSKRQQLFAEENQISQDQLDLLEDKNLLEKFDVYCSHEGVAGNGALMRLAPVPLFFYQDPIHAVEYSGISGQITHGDQKAYDACRYYGALIVAALHGEKKEQLLDKDFYLKHLPWFSDKPLHQDVLNISQGSFKKLGGYDDGIRGKGYIIDALEAALWAFWSDENSFEIGALNAVNLGDDTDTTAAIYGQLAGAFYGYNQLPSKWIDQIYAKKYLHIISKWMTHLSQQQQQQSSNIPKIKIITVADVDDNSSILSDIPDQIHHESNTIDVDSKQQDTTFNHSEDKLDNNHIIHDSSDTISDSFEQKQDNQNVIFNHSQVKEDSDDTTNNFYDTISDSFEQTQDYQNNEKKTNKISYQQENLPTTSSTSIEKRTIDNYVNIPIVVTKKTQDEQYSKTNTRPTIVHIEKIDHRKEEQTQYKQFSPNKMLMSWTVNDVCQWIQSFGYDYKNYLDSFRNDHTDGFRLFNFINDRVLIEFGVQNSNNRQTILDGIQQLRQKFQNSPRFYM